jgi:hypothetical protein
MEKHTKSQQSMKLPNHAFSFQNKPDQSYKYYCKIQILLTGEAAKGAARLQAYESRSLEIPVVC